jgi:hypothetical protein
VVTVATASLSEGVASAQVRASLDATPRSPAGIAEVESPAGTDRRAQRNLQPIRDSLSTIDYGAIPRAGALAQSAPSARRRSTTRKILGGAAGATGGFFAGGYLGAAIEGDRCQCDDPGLKGALIGAPVGAVIGGILGAMFF